MHSGTKVQSQDLFAIAKWLNENKVAIEDVERPSRDVYQAGNTSLAIEHASMTPPGKAVEQIVSIRRCVDWALPQWKCGNMSDCDVFEYLFFVIARIHPNAIICGLAERLRIAEDQVQHLEYLRSRKE